MIIEHRTIWIVYNISVPILSWRHRRVRLQGYNVMENWTILYPYMYIHMHFHYKSEKSLSKLSNMSAVIDLSSSSVFKQIIYIQFQIWQILHTEIFSKYPTRIMPLCAFQSCASVNLNSISHDARCCICIQIRYTWISRTRGLLSASQLVLARATVQGSSSVCK